VNTHYLAFAGITATSLHLPPLFYKTELISCRTYIGFFLLAPQIQLPLTIVRVYKLYLLTYLLTYLRTNYATHAAGNVVFSSKSLTARLTYGALAN